MTETDEQLARLRQILFELGTHLREVAATATRCEDPTEPYASGPGLVGTGGSPVAQMPTNEARRSPELIVNMAEHRVLLRGKEIPIKPPNNLQRQPLIALAVLTSRPGKTIGADELAEGMSRLGGLGESAAADLSDLRNKVLRPLRRLFPEQAAELGHLIQATATTIRLNLPPEAVLLLGARGLGEGSTGE